MRPKCHVYVTVLRSRSPNYFTGTIRPCSSDSSRSPVHLNRPPSTFSALFSVPVSSTILHPRLRHHSPSSSPEPSSLLVSGTVLHPRIRGYVLTTRRQTLRRCRCLFCELFSGLDTLRPVHVTVLHPRHRRRSPSSFSAALFFGGYY